MGTTDYRLCLSSQLRLKLNTKLQSHIIICSLKSLSCWGESMERTKGQCRELLIKAGQETLEILKGEQGHLGEAQEGHPGRE